MKRVSFAIPTKSLNKSDMGPSMTISHQSSSPNLATSSEISPFSRSKAPQINPKTSGFSILFSKDFSSQLLTASRRPPVSKLGDSSSRPSRKGTPPRLIVHDIVMSQKTMLLENKLKVLERESIVKEEKIKTLEEQLSQKKKKQTARVQKEITQELKIKELEEHLSKSQGLSNQTGEGNSGDFIETSELKAKVKGLEKSLQEKTKETEKNFQSVEKLSSENIQLLEELTELKGKLSQVYTELKRSQGFCEGLRHEEKKKREELASKSKELEEKNKKIQMIFQEAGLNEEIDTQRAIKLFKEKEKRFREGELERKRLKEELSDARDKMEELSHDLELKESIFWEVKRKQAEAEIKLMKRENEKQESTLIFTAKIEQELQMKLDKMNKENSVLHRRLAEIEGYNGSLIKGLNRANESLATLQKDKERLEEEVIELQRKLEEAVRQFQREKQESVQEVVELKRSLKEKEKTISSFVFTKKQREMVDPSQEKEVSQDPNVKENPPISAKETPGKKENPWKETRAKEAPATEISFSQRKNGEWDLSEIMEEQNPLGVPKTKGELISHQNGPEIIGNRASETRSLGIKGKRGLPSRETSSSPQKKREMQEETKLKRGTVEEFSKGKRSSPKTMKKFEMKKQKTLFESVEKLDWRKELDQNKENKHSGLDCMIDESLIQENTWNHDEDGHETKEINELLAPFSSKKPKESPTFEKSLKNTSSFPIGQSQLSLVKADPKAFQEIKERLFEPVFTGTKGKQVSLADQLFEKKLILFSNEALELSCTRSFFLNPAMKRLYPVFSFYYCNKSQDSIRNIRVEWIGDETCDLMVKPEGLPPILKSKETFKQGAILDIKQFPYTIVEMELSFVVSPENQMEAKSVIVPMLPFQLIQMKECSKEEFQSRWKEASHQLRTEEFEWNEPRAIQMLLEQMTQINENEKGAVFQFDQSEGDFLMKFHAKMGGMGELAIGSAGEGLQPVISKWILESLLFFGNFPENIQKTKG